MLRDNAAARDFLAILHESGPGYMKMDHAIRNSREALEQYLAKRTVPEGR